MLSWFMVWSSSVLGIRPNAPRTGQDIYKPVTPEQSNGIFYPLSFQRSRNPWLPLLSRWSSVVIQRKTPSISFPLISLRDSFLHDDGGTPPSPHLLRSTCFLPLSSLLATH